MKIINIGNKVVNNYILETDKGYVVIDTGYPGSYPRFSEGLKKTGIDKQEIKFIFITHVHDDHVGFLNELISDTHATIIMHEESPGRLLTGHNKYAGGCPNLFAKIFLKILSLAGKGKHEFPVVKLNETDNVILWNGENQFFKQSGIGLEIIAFPGHTSDSIGLLTDDGILFCGDACMNDFPSLKRNILWIENLEDYKKSWDKMIGGPAKEIYPSHGSPFPKTDLIKYRSNLNKIKLHKTELSQE
jgi:glyoxylase-like metal-dependent hydrolase (beta-lactamase superfamily II)